MGQKVTTFLWFERQAEEATRFYTSVFKDAEIVSINRMGEDGPVFTTSFKLFGQEYIALNGGPQFKFTEAISLMVDCETQDEIDYYWSALTEGGEESQCGWLKDKFGLSWQVTPRKVLDETLGGSNPEGAGRAMQAMMQMRKFDIAGLKAAYAGS
jgi:predicted 3-demethylubiquinone-9 3-methyltransferase (glyoxalase superfamily)